MNEEKKQQVIAFGRLGWSLRRIERNTGVRRETAAAYLKAAGIAFRPPGGWGRQPPAKPANEVITDFGAELAASTWDQRLWAMHSSFPVLIAGNPGANPTPNSNAIVLCGFPPRVPMVQAARRGPEIRRGR